MAMLPELQAPSLRPGHESRAFGNLQRHWNQVLCDRDSIEQFEPALAKKSLKLIDRLLLMRRAGDVGQDPAGAHKITGTT